MLAALHELLRGFQGAHAHSGERLLQEWLSSASRREDVYGGLLTVILRLIFVLYAEDRGLLSGDAAWQDGYSVLSLFDRLREDADRFPDTMEHRYGAWAQLLATFRLVFDGGRHGALQLPARHGYLFHPDGGDAGVGDPPSYQFLEGRPYGEARQVGAVVTPPRIPDKVVWEVLRNLLVLDGERISYRTLNVEQIGSVYETMMGFRFERTAGPSLAVKPQKQHGAPVFVDCTALLAEAAGARVKWLKAEADCELAEAAAEKLKRASTPDEVFAALGKKVSALTPAVLPAGAFVLQPTEARRRSGTFYSPPQLTRPIVETTLRPLLEQLGEKPKAEQVLELKVCDPAMGSGAFLVEACRQLGARVMQAWAEHPGSKPVIPPDEDELLFAKRLVATRCLYGVDKNPFAVALGKLSLWLETFAKDHAFTFVDHALRCGDSLVGLSKAQIAAFHWDVTKRGAFVETLLKAKLKEVEAARKKIREADESTREGTLRRWLREAEDALDDVRLIGDLVVAAYFGEEKDKAREGRRQVLAAKVEAWLRAGGSVLAAKDELRREVAELRAGAKGLPPFHWEIEFPEVFARGGFDGFVGNPPFAGKNTIIDGHRDGYLDWLKRLHEESHGNSDLVAHFFRRCFDLLRAGGTLGLIATKTIRQGDTRTTGLRWICKHGGSIFSATRRIKWPGEAAVVVSIVHVAKGSVAGPCNLDGRRVARITAFLFDDGGHDDPVSLPANVGRSFIGTYVLGMGFTFDDTSDAATPLAEMERLIARNPTNRERIFPYLGGEEVNDSPTHAHHRYVINFGEMDEHEAHSGWPDLMQIVEARVRPGRLAQNDAGAKEKWWQFIRPRPELAAAIRGMDRLLVVGRNCDRFGFAFLPSGMVCSEQLVVFALTSYAAFAACQSRLHESWVRFFGSSMKDDLRYTPTDCFETFPFPEGFESHPRLEAAGKAYYEFRASLMADPAVRRQLMPGFAEPEGLTKTYNRFHTNDRDEPPPPGIQKLRELHAEMDRAVLDAYGWTDLHPTHEFLLDYEEENDEDDTNGRTRRRKKPWRYRWPDDFHDEVLMRLLRLNQERAEQERTQTRTTVPAPKSRRARGARKNPTPNLPGMGDPG
ncbi:MAG TPA: DNA methyltransferase [Planctomycetota bacterium]|nr:DNA methyltransferase [Planctomycetota bacterium]